MTELATIYPPFKIKEYKLVIGWTRNDTVKKVNEHLKQGWVLWGSPFVSEDFIRQATILIDDERGTSK